MSQGSAENLSMVDNESKILEYEKKISNLTNLLGKAKVALDNKTKQYNQKVNFLEYSKEGVKVDIFFLKLQELEECKQTTKSLEDIVNKYLGEDSKESIKI
jgi:hypothetical protein